MTRLVLANIDYRMHMTDEGDQFQRGLEAAGWMLAGTGYGDGCRDVAELLARHQPTAVVVHDKRDWDPCMRQCFRKDVGFERLHALKDSDVDRFVVVKDAGTFQKYHRAFCEEVEPSAVITYYHDTSVVSQSPFLSNYRLVRTWHSIDADLVGCLDLSGPRKMAVVSGAVNPAVYPLRQAVMDNAARFGIEVVRHPGYGNRGNATPHYLNMLTRYKVHVATASRFGFALRKIIESVACGAIPITDLPAYDPLPEIDGALLRVSPSITMDELADTIRWAAEEWNMEERQWWAEKARERYDYRLIGKRLSEQLREEPTCL